MKTTPAGVVPDGAVGLPKSKTAYLTALLADRGQLNRLGDLEAMGLESSTAFSAPQPPAGGARSETLENGTTLVQTTDAGALVVEGALVEWLEAAAKRARPEGIQAKQAASSAEFTTIGGLRDTLVSLGLPQADAEVYLEGLRQGQGLVIVHGQVEALKRMALGFKHQLWAPTQQSTEHSPAIATGSEAQTQDDTKKVSPPIQPTRTPQV